MEGYDFVASFQLFSPAGRLFLSKRKLLRHHIVEQEKPGRSTFLFLFSGAILAAINYARVRTNRRRRRCHELLLFLDRATGSEEEDDLTEQIACRV